jgi:hypothetical protein
MRVLFGRLNFAAAILGPMHHACKHDTMRSGGLTERRTENDHTK